MQEIDFGDGKIVFIPTAKLRPETTLYLAGRQGFTEAERPFHNNLVRLIKLMGGQIEDPWQLTDPAEIQKVLQMEPGPEQIKAWQRVNRLIGLNNHHGIERSTGIVANLDGPDVDSGTASEIGAGAVLGKRTLGYRGDFRPAGDNPGAIVNLQVEHYIYSSGGQIIRTITDMPRYLLQYWG